MIGRRMIAIAVAMLASLTLTIGACDDADAPTPARPSSAFGAGGTGAPGGTPPSAVDTGDTDGDAPGSDQETAPSSARLELRGDIDEDLRLTAQEPIVVSAPPGGLGVTWSDAGSANRFTIAGVSFTGTRDTDPTTIMTLFLMRDGRQQLFLSNSGECAITIDAVSDTGMRGSVQCRNLRARIDDATIDLAGTFAVEA